MLSLQHPQGWLSIIPKAGETQLAPMQQFNASTHTPMTNKLSNLSIAISISSKYISSTIAKLMMIDRYWFIMGFI